MTLPCDELRSWIYLSDDLKLRGESRRIDDRRSGVGLADFQELAILRVVAEHLAGLELVDPAVQIQRITGESRRNGRMSAQVFQLNQHVLLNGDVQQTIVTQI